MAWRYVLPGYRKEGRAWCCVGMTKLLFYTTDSIPGMWFGQKSCGTESEVHCLVLLTPVMTVSIGIVEPIFCSPLSYPPFLQDVFAGRGAEERKQCHSRCDAEGTSPRCSWVLEVTAQTTELNRAQWRGCRSPAHVTWLPAVCLSLLSIAFEPGGRKQWP